MFPHALFRRWRREQSGTTAVEFGMIAPLFFALLLGSGDAGWLMTKAMLLDQAVTKSVRTLRIGGEGAPTTHNQLRKLICDETILIPDCNESLLIEITVVKSASSFPTASMPCIDRGKPAPSTNFTTGGRSDMLFLRACLTTDPLFPLVGNGLGLPRTEQGRFNLISLSGFMNEPGV